MPGAKRGTSWYDTNIQVQIAAGGATSNPIALLPADVLVRDVPGLTVTRTLVNLSIHPVVPVSVFGGQQVRIGMGIVTQDAFLAGALPELGAVSEEPVRGWMFKNESFSFQSENSFQFDSLDLDIKAQRILDLDTEVFLVIQNVDLTGTAFSVEVTGLIRMLVKLP